MHLPLRKLTRLWSSLPEALWPRRKGRGKDVALSACLPPAEPGMGNGGRGALLPPAAGGQGSLLACAPQPALHRPAGPARGSAGHPPSFPPSRRWREIVQLSPAPGHTEMPPATAAAPRRRPRRLRGARLGSGGTSAPCPHCPDCSF